MTGMPWPVFLNGLIPTQLHVLGMLRSPVLVEAHAGGN